MMESMLVYLIPPVLLLWFVISFFVVKKNITFADETIDGRHKRILRRGGV